MKIVLLSDDRLRLEADPGPLTIEALSEEQTYSPFHMVASGLAVCGLSVLASWAAHADLPTEGLALEVSWRFADRPHRVGRYDIAIRWPGLPPERREAALRALRLCPIHQTLEHPPEIHAEVTA